MRRALLSAVVLSLMPCLVLAGAWPREKGSAFVSAEQSVEWAKGEAVDGTGATGDATADTDARVAAGFTTLYGEYGLTARLTLGAKLGMTADRMRNEGLLFARYPLGAGNGANRFAAELGVGVTLDGGQMSDVLVRPGLSWGRGYDSRLGPGWMGVEATVTRGLQTGAQWANIDTTIGLTPHEGRHAILQVRHYRDDAGSATTLAPSYVHPLPGRVKAQVGATWRIGDDSRPGVFFGSWLEF